MTRQNQPEPTRTNMGNLNFDASNVPDAPSFDPLPPGYYTALIVESGLKASSTAGEMVAFAFEIDGDEHPQFRGRKIWTNLCIHHPNPKPQAIARQQLAAICKATKRLQIRDTSDLLGGKLRIKLKVQPARDGYDARNEVAGYQELAARPGAATAGPARVATPTPTPNRAPNVSAPPRSPAAAAAPAAATAPTTPAPAAPATPAPAAPASADPAPTSASNPTLDPNATPGWKR